MDGGKKLRIAYKSYPFLLYAALLDTSTLDGAK